MEEPYKIADICKNKDLYYCVNLRQIKLEIWKKNRMVDDLRVNELKNMYSKYNYTTIPGYISVFLKDNRYYIYDGAHRYRAGEIYNKDMKMILSILNTDDEQEIWEDFNNVNKSVPIPEVYLTDDERIQLCNDVVNYYIRKYRKFQSPSFRCRKPHFNKDKFTQLLSECIPNKNITVEKIINELNDLNYEIKDKSNHDKCKKYNFYLFSVDDSYIKDKLRNM